jgi:predicted amidohydrolase YtcJ
MRVPADVIVRAKTVQTVGPQGTVEAVAVKDGRVLAVGSSDDVLRHRTAATELFDLGEATLVPGLIEPHTHPDLCAQMYSWVDISGFARNHVDDVLRDLARARNETPTSDWIFAFGLDPMLTNGLGTWDRDRLDQLFPDHPAVIMIQSMHTIFVNSMALRLAGITDDTPDPPGGGEYLRDASGRLNGIVREAPAMNVFVRFFKQDAAVYQQAMRDQYDRYRTVGITSIGMPGTFTNTTTQPLFLEVARAAHIRTTSYVRAPQMKSLRAEDRVGDRYRVGGVKLWYDGSPYSGTMLLDEPYLDSDLCCCTLGIEAGTVGHANFAGEEMVETLRDLARGGWQVLTHAQGDRGCREILDVYEQVLADVATNDHRWRLEHCALVSRPDLARMATLGVSPSFHVNHVLHYGPELRDHILGPERSERLMPISSAVEAGHRVSLHADSPMYPAGPLSLMRTAVTRRTRHGDQIAAHEAIAVQAALRAVTIDAAWQLGTDSDVGSIEVGKRADFAVLSDDPHSVASIDIDKIEVISTWLDGVALR